MPHVNEVYVTGGAHDQYADEQLANLQKRIYLIEFLHLGLVIGCQGAMLGLPKLQPTFVVGFNFEQSAPTGYARATPVAHGEYENTQLEKS